VLQAIEDLEPVTRGVYCGAVGWIDAGELHQPPPRETGELHPPPPRENALELNVAIRTFQIVAGRTHLGVGGGITVDSDPAAEWRETELKAARLLAVAGAPEKAGTGGRIGVPA